VEKAGRGEGKENHQQNFVFLSSQKEPPLLSLTPPVSPILSRASLYLFPFVIAFLPSFLSGFMLRSQSLFLPSYLPSKLLLRVAGGRADGWQT
jgi:hypothetical protein